MAKKTETGELKFQIEWMDIDLLEEADANPRKIKKNELKNLMNSISEFPEMLQIRPIVHNGKKNASGKFEVVGGNKRLLACRHLGWKKVPVINGKSLTPAQMKEFMIRDNVHHGEWDMEKLQEWDDKKLVAWGVIEPEQDQESPLQGSGFHGAGSINESSGGNNEQTNQTPVHIPNTNGEGFKCPHCGQLIEF